MYTDETLGHPKKLGYAKNTLWLKQKINPIVHDNCLVYDGASVSVWTWSDLSSAEESSGVVASSFKSDGRWLIDGVLQKSYSSIDEFSNLRISPGSMIAVPGVSGGLYYSTVYEGVPDNSETFATAVSGIVMKKFPTGDNSISGLIDNVSEISYVVNPSAQSNGRISGVVVSVDSGSLTLSVNVNGNPVSGLSSIAVDPTVKTTKLENPVSFAAEDQISISVSGISSAQRLSFIVLIS